MAKGKKRGMTGRKKIDDKKTLVGAYIRESDVKVLGGKPACRDMATKHLEKEAARKHKVRP